MANLRECFELLTALPASERSAWLHAQPMSEQQRDLLMRMLGSEGQADIVGPILDFPERLQRLMPMEVDTAIANAWVGRSVGPFKLIRLIGQGGMGAIFLAHREGADFSQQVAVKILRQGVFSELELRLFRRERQALASLSHANIARLVDGGVTESGTPYLAMELVEGIAIDRFCIDRRLEPRPRLHLLLQVCRAVEHAHASLIVHRDIKPSNVLVTEQGTPKLLDFGIAKLLERDEGETHTAHAALTPEYAAPEQFSGGVITTATDVYALGILMHELLLGERPTQKPPRRPSSRVIELQANVGALSAPVPVMRNLLRGDLDNIIMKALQLDPQRRYASAGMLADDLERYLQGLPVAAHPPSRWYRLRKFAQRNRSLMAVTAIMLTAVLASLAYSLWQTQVARQQTVRAEQELARATAATDFMLGIFEDAAPSGPSTQAPSVADLLTSGARALRENPKLDQDSRDALLIKLASVQRRWGSLKDAAKNAEQVVASRHSETQPLDRIGLMAVEQWMMALLVAQEYDEVNRIYSMFGERASKIAPDIAPVLLSISSNADGWNIREQALAKARTAVALCNTHCKPEDRLRVRRNLADVLDDIDPAAPGAARDLAEAEMLMRALLKDSPTVDGPNHPNVADDYFQLSYDLRKLGRLEEAAVNADIGLARINSIYEKPHARKIVHYLNAGRIAAARDQKDQAVVLLREAMNLHLALLADDTHVLPTIVIELANAELATGTQMTALPHLKRVRTLLNSVFIDPPDDRIARIDEFIRLGSIPSR